MASSSPGLNETTWASMTDDVGRGLRAAVLLIFMLVTFVGDVFLLTVAAFRRRRIVQNTLIVNMCAVGLLDCICNMGLVLGSLASNDWKLGRALCKANAFFMSLVAIQASLMLFAFSLDRYLMLRFSSKYESWLSSCRLTIILAYIWLHSVAFSIPFITDSVPSIFCFQLHICTVAGQTPLVFICISLLACHLCPVLMTVGLHIIYSRLSCKMKFLRKPDNDKTYTQMSKVEVSMTCAQGSFHSVYFPLALFILWIILDLPFIMTNYVKQYEYSQRLEKDAVLLYPWEVDVTFLWMRFLYTAIFPGVVLLFKKELWQSIKDCCLCRRSNAIVDIKHVIESKDLPILNEAENNSPVSKTEDRKEHQKEREAQIATSNASAFTVPVLFATTTGICIEDSSCKQEHPLDDAKENTYSSGLTLCKGKTLDISYPEYDYAQELIGDTSDYDSSCEVDTYSLSQPISVRNIHSSSQRSVSNPDMSSYTSFQHKYHKSKSRGFSSASGADSGLDLTDTHSLANYTFHIKYAKVKSDKSNDRHSEITSLPSNGVNTDLAIENSKQLGVIFAGKKIKKESLDTKETKIVQTESCTKSTQEVQQSVICKHENE